MGFDVLCTNDNENRRMSLCGGMCRTLSNCSGELMKRLQPEGQTVYTIWSLHHILLFDHMPCITQMLQRSITVSLTDSGFVSALSKCRKIVGHFKHSPAKAVELNAEQFSLRQKQDMVHMIWIWSNTWSAIKQHYQPPWTSYLIEILGGEAYVSCSVVPTCVMWWKCLMRTQHMWWDLKKSSRKTCLPPGTHEHCVAQVATALDSCFKDLKSVSKTEKKAVLTMLWRHDAWRINQKMSIHFWRWATQEENKPSPAGGFRFWIRGRGTAGQTHTQIQGRALH